MVSLERQTVEQAKVAEARTRRLEGLVAHVNQPDGHSTRGMRKNANAAQPTWGTQRQQA